MSDDKPNLNQAAAVDTELALDSQQTAPASKIEEEQHRAVKDYNAAKTKTKLSMKVRVYSPFRDYYDGQAFSVSAVNDTGPFDILPKHHNFISLLTKCELVIRTVDKGDQKIIISGGIMHVKADSVVVFLDI